MEYRRLGAAGLKLSALSLGSWISFGIKTGLAEARECLALAKDHGVNFFDSAEVYAYGEAERMLGTTIRELGWPRDSFCVSSKVMMGAIERPAPTQRGLSRKHVIEACDQALARLKVDYLDLYFCHRPDPDTTVEEIVWTMHGLIERGKVFYWGTSEWPVASLKAAIAFARENHLVGPQMEQSQYNLLYRGRVENELAPLCDEGLGVTTWSPLALGLLSGKYNDGIPEGSRLSLPRFSYLTDMLLGGNAGRARHIETVRRLQPVAQALGVTLPQMAIAWCLRNPHVSTVILGASSLDQLRENLGAAAITDRLMESVVEEIAGMLAD
jgi:voltage-dependent potassium channel beta subunit